MSQSPLSLPSHLAGAPVVVLAQQYDIFVQRSTAAIMVSTVLSVLTLSAPFLMLGRG